MKEFLVYPLPERHSASGPIFLGAGALTNTTAVFPQHLHLTARIGSTDIFKMKVALVPDWAHNLTAYFSMGFSAGMIRLTPLPSIVSASRTFWTYSRAASGGRATA